MITEKMSNKLWGNKKRIKYLIIKYLTLNLYPDPGSNRDGCYSTGV